MLPFNEKCTIVKKTQIKDPYGSITETTQNLGEFWCGVVSHETFVRIVKGGNKRSEEIRLQVWLNHEITNSCDVTYGNTKFTALNVLHNRVRGITTILAIHSN